MRRQNKKGLARIAHRLTYIINNAAFFESHRMPLAMASRANGFDPELITGMAGSIVMEQPAIKKIADAKLAHLRLNFTASSVNPLREASALTKLTFELRKRRPSLVHCASPKGNIYGGIAARLAGVPSVVLAISGQGFVAASTGKMNLFRACLRLAGRILNRFAFGHPHKRVIVQNSDDYDWALESGLANRNELRLIPGSGVDLDLFSFSADYEKSAQIVFPARMISDKGVHEFVAAARVLRQRYPNWRFLLAGTADYNSPTAIAPEILRAWEEEGVVEWLGHVEDMPSLLKKSAIVCLPSYYREGLPKALLEAAACGAAVVTTDAVGCRDTIVPGKTGLLVPVRDVPAITHALEQLIMDPDMRREFGISGRRRIEKGFSLKAVVEQTMAIYEELRALN